MKPYVVDERDVVFEERGSQTYRIEVWVHPGADGAWQAVTVYEVQAKTALETIAWARREAQKATTAFVVVGVLLRDPDGNRFVAIYEETIGRA
jgi:hypothetical protein